MPGLLLKKQFLLPDLLALCPLKGATNPHHQEAGAESSAWINSFNVFTDKKRAFFVQGCNELLVSHTYPYAGYEQFRTCCDFVNLLFVVDEVSDDQNGRDARQTCQNFLDAMTNPENSDCSTLSQITREFRARYFKLAGPGTSRRFLQHCADYIECVSREAELRERGEVLSVESFTPLRRENSAIRLCFGLFEYVLGIDLPEEVFDCPVFMEAYWAAADLVCWANDVYSYNMEQAKGHSGNNIVTVLMNEYGFGLQQTCDYIGTYVEKLMTRFLSAKSRLPSWGPEVDAEVAMYVEAMGHWIKGNLDWSFETQRYFGPLHFEIKKTRLVTLRPPSSPEDDYEPLDSDRE
ncbi:terpenoid synthase [Dendrothele bispora CBS 962.96]|uniref:Terpene synthase n=1 Tax=Dendrothele bispora (strain CBS 962.96) TaxID=1314807 RepID=A0A4S8MJB6_DENBC|nr:terpenoid synthase [Dendrothele bispora CBS 962.96]